VAWREGVVCFGGRAKVRWPCGKLTAGDLPFIIIVFNKTENGKNCKRGRYSKKTGIKLKIIKKYYWQRKEFLISGLCILILCVFVYHGWSFYSYWLIIGFMDPNPKKRNPRLCFHSHQSQDGWEFFTAYRGMGYCFLKKKRRGTFFPEGPVDLKKRSGGNFLIFSFLAIIISINGRVCDHYYSRLFSPVC